MEGQELGQGEQEAGQGGQEHGQGDDIVPPLSPCTAKKGSNHYQSEMFFHKRAFCEGKPNRSYLLRY